MKLIFLLLITISITGCYSSNPQTTGKEGTLMPDFQLLSTDSMTWHNTKLLSIDSPTVFFYFSPHCPYCKTQTRQIIDNIDKLKNIRFYFISNFPIAELNSYNKAFNLERFLNITTVMDVSKSVSDYFEITGVPYLALYNKDKILIKTFMGGKLYSSQIKKIVEE